MSEQQLRDFGARAETLVEIPDFAEVERKGTLLRARRRVGVAAALVVVLTVAGVSAAQSHRSSADRGPVTPPPPRSAAARTYPGSPMTTLDQGNYWLQTCCIPGHPTSEFAANPVVEFAVPKGWNSWVGPNRFNGHAPGRTNEEALGHSTWYVGALILEVDAVNTRGCGNPEERRVGTAHALLAALRRAPGFQVIQGPEQDRRFEYPATRIRVRVAKLVADCPDDAIFHSTTAGMIGYLGPGELADIWVVDVDGYPMYVQRAWSQNAPHAARSQLDSVIDSIRFSFRE